MVMNEANTILTALIPTGTSPSAPTTTPKEKSRSQSAKTRSAEKTLIARVKRTCQKCIETNLRAVWTIPVKNRVC